ncbi:MAG TPA: flagellar protein FlaG [Micropepsaceae bacterium]|jgi:flagellar protein FlaG|nr:flagellar protein FlaG [Micropepsaceae bacterium]
MVDPISNAPNPREIGQTQARPQPSPTSPAAPDPSTNLGPDQRVVVLQAVIEKLLRKSMPSNSKLQIVQDKTTGTYIYRAVDPQTGEVISQYPSEELVKLHDYLAEMSGMLVDKKV